MLASKPWPELLTSLNDAELREFLDSLSEPEAEALAYDWPSIARPEQLPPSGNWRIWLVDAGRGFGKTRTGAEWVRACVRDFSLVNIIGATADDARDIMIEGESGILSVCSPDERPAYKKAERRLEWPNGARTLIFTADEPERLRGKQHMKLWADEVGAWRYPEAWDQAMFGLRLGADPQAVATTTPRPVRIVRDLLAREGQGVVVTRGSTYDNRANLAPGFFSEIITKYEGTRLGRQELLAELLSDTPGALWTRERLEANRVTEHPPLHRIVVGVDPEASSGEDSAETGIVVLGAARVGSVLHGYVLDDLTIRGTPGMWGSAAVAAYHKHRADRLLGEVNNGGEMVGYVIRTTPGGEKVAYKAVHASRGKQARAEPVAGLDEQGRLHMVGYYPDLEDQLCSWVPGAEKSPDRLDALVWAATEALLSDSDMQPLDQATATALAEYLGR